MAAASVPKLYRNVIDDVINNVREIFLDEGVDEQILLEFKQTWERKLVETKAVEYKEPEKGAETSTNNMNVNMNSSTSGGGQGGNSRGNHNNRHPAHFQDQSSSALRSINPSIRQLNSQAPPPSLPLPLPLPQPQRPESRQTPIMSSPATAATLALPPDITATLLQQFGSNNVMGCINSGQTVVHQGGMGEKSIHQYNQTSNSGSNVMLASGGGTPAKNPSNGGGSSGGSSQNRIVQLDGPNESSDDDEEEDEYRDNDDDHEENDEEEGEGENDYTGEEEEPLNSEDDVSDEDPSELFDSENVVVCQYDKIARSRNKWKFHLKDGIMNLQSKDYVFQKAIGDAEW